MAPLTPARRRELRALAHHLEPVVTVGHQGLSAPVLHEIDVALLAHDLVKVRVLGDDREARESMLAQACAALDCAPVQHVGKVLVLYRPNPERAKLKPTLGEAQTKPSAARRRANPAARAPVDPVRERRRRLSSSGRDTASAGNSRRRRSRS